MRSLVVRAIFIVAVVFLAFQKAEAQQTLSYDTLCDTQQQMEMYATLLQSHHRLYAMRVVNAWARNDVCQEYFGTWEAGSVVKILDYGRVRSVKTSEIVGRGDVLVPVEHKIKFIFEITEIPECFEDRWKNIKCG